MRHLLPPAPRDIPNVTWISSADNWRWRVGKAAYDVLCRTVPVQVGLKNNVKPWGKLSRAEKDAWYWNAYAVMTALDDIE